MVYDEVNLKSVKLNTDAALYCSGLHQKVPWIQCVTNGNFQSKRSWHEYMVSEFETADNIARVVVSGNWGCIYQDVPAAAEHWYVLSVQIKAATSIQNIGINIQGAYEDTKRYTGEGDWQTITWRFKRNASSNPNFRISVRNTNVSAVPNLNIYIKNFMFFDETEMFGEGNEPTTADFFTLYPLKYYPTNY